jgi:hypothetical protein
MAVVATTIIQVKPDRWEEGVELTRKAKSITEGHGGKNFRMLAGHVAGQQTGTVVVTVEVDNFVAYGALEDKILADPQRVAMMSGGEGSPIAGFQTSLFVDVPL